MIGSSIHFRGNKTGKMDYKMFIFRKKGGNCNERESFQ